MKQPKVEEAPVVIVACADLEGWRSGDLDEIIRLAQQHGYGDEARYASMRKNIANFFSAPGNAGGLAPDFAVWANRQTMIAFTTMMWMAEVLGYDTAPMEGFYEDQVKATLGIPAHVRVVALLAIGHHQRRRQALRRTLRHAAHGICREVGESDSVARSALTYNPDGFGMPEARFLT